LILGDIGSDPMTDLSLFIERVAASGLMTAAALKDRLRPIEPTRPDAVDQAARLLIETGDLTPFQVKKLRTGLTKGFFLGRWRLMRPLASGGSSRVMLARDEREGGFVALKVVPPRASEHRQGLDDDHREAILARFRRELEVARRVIHPRIARVFRLESVEGVDFLVMEYIPGVSLEASIAAHGPWKPRRAARYAVDLLPALTALHAVGIIHRDLKPANLMLTPQGHACLLDLGTALVPGLPPLPLDDNGILGTPDYIAPEQIDHPDQVGPTGDLYALGCVLYCLVCGRPPFAGGSPINKIVKHRFDTPLFPEDLEPDFREILTSLLAKEPHRRPASASALRAQLKAWVQHHPSS